MQHLTGHILGFLGLILHLLLIMPKVNMYELVFGSISIAHSRLLENKMQKSSETLQNMKSHKEMPFVNKRLMLTSCPPEIQSDV